VVRIPPSTNFFLSKYKAHGLEKLTREVFLPGNPNPGSDFPISGPENSDIGFRTRYFPPKYRKRMDIKSETI